MSYCWRDEALLSAAQRPHRREPPKLHRAWQGASSGVDQRVLYRQVPTSSSGATSGACIPQHTLDSLSDRGPIRALPSSKRLTYAVMPFQALKRNSPCVDCHETFSVLVLLGERPRLASNLNLLLDEHKATQPRGLRDARQLTVQPCVKGGTDTSSAHVRHRTR